MQRCTKRAGWRRARLRESGRGLELCRGNGCGSGSCGSRSDRCCLRNGQLDGAGGGLFLCRLCLGLVLGSLGCSGCGLVLSESGPLGRGGYGNACVFCVLELDALGHQASSARLVLAVDDGLGCGCGFVGLLLGVEGARRLLGLEGLDGRHCGSSRLGLASLLLGGSLLGKALALCGVEQAARQAQHDGD